ncbi:MAG TPA: hypothetical protein VNB86_04435 [Gaiellaceae bacterium]|nr:hypothetical protein [Gaiellaceae bacterium]
MTVLAHGGTAGAIVEASFALLIVALALAVWVGSRRDDEEQDRG